KRPSVTFHLPPLALVFTLFSRNVTDTSSPSSAQPQTGAWTFCCKTIPSEKSAGRRISALAAYAKPRAMPGANNLERYVEFMFHRATKTQFPRQSKLIWQVPMDRASTPDYDRFARQSNTAPTAWKIKLGSQTIRCGANSGRVSRAFPRTMKL